MADIVFRTSGSSGSPKEIARTDESLWADARALVAGFREMWEGIRLVAGTIPRDHMFGELWLVRSPAARGCHSLEEPVGSVEELAEVSSGGGVLLATTPSFLEKAVEHPAFAGLRGKIAAVVTSGSPLRRETALAVGQALGACPLEIYGSTEAGTVGWRRRENGEEWNVFAGVEVRIGREGQLVVDSPYAMERPLAMGDAARLVGNRKFELLGRTDRRVKILEEYVQLGDVERALEGHPLVAVARAEAFGTGVARVGALVVPTPAGRTALASGTFGAVRRQLRQDLLGKVGKLAFPRRIRFLRALPADARGKTTSAAAKAALAAWCQEPVVLEWTATADTLRAVMVFPPDTECFDGHFPGFALLPGVAQLFFLRHFARQAFGDFPDAGTWRRIKFQRIARPGEPLVLKVERRGCNAFAFAYTKASEPVSSGVVEGGVR